MAKSKKTASGQGDAQAAGGKGKKPAGAKPAKATAPPAAPLIDTKLAAAAAAKVVAHKDASTSSAAADDRVESSAFKQLKEHLNKPSGQSTHSFLQAPAAGKKFNNAVPGRNQQLGRNQTFGADVNRSGVPRRTGGG